VYVCVFVGYCLVLGKPTLEFSLRMELLPEPRDKPRTTVGGVDRSDCRGSICSRHCTLTTPETLTPVFTEIGRACDFLDLTAMSNLCLSSTPTPHLCLVNSNRYWHTGFIPCINKALANLPNLFPTEPQSCPLPCKLLPFLSSVIRVPLSIVCTRVLETRLIQPQDNLSHTSWF
jgi:hypothetical protein